MMNIGSSAMMNSLGLVAWNRCSACPERVFTMLRNLSEPTVSIREIDAG